MRFTPYTEQGMKAAIKRLEFFALAQKDVTVESIKNTRSSKQNSALHLLFTQISDLLNSKGITHESIAGFEAPFTMEHIKFSWWHPIQFAMFGTKSTTKLDTKQINEIFDVISMHLSGIFGESIEFPSLESLEKKTQNE